MKKPKDVINVSQLPIAKDVMLHLIASNVMMGFYFSPMELTAKYAMQSGIILASWIVKQSYLLRNANCDN